MGIYAKSLRLLRLLHIFHSKAGYLTAPVLAEKSGVSVRTVYRDLEALEQLGVSVYYDNGYRILAPPPSTALSVSAHDAGILRLLIQSSPLLKIPYFNQACLDLQAKFDALTSYTSESSTPPIRPAEPPSSTRLAFRIQDLEQAISRRNALQILYQGLEEKSPGTRLIHPYILTIRGGEWYLVAYHPERKDTRLYRLERIRKLEIRPETFTQDPNFDFTTFFHRSFSVFRGEPLPVKIECRGKAARLASERPWHEGMACRWTAPDVYLVEGPLVGEQELRAWILSLGADALVLEPESLRRSVQAALKATLQLYKK